MNSKNLASKLNKVIEIYDYEENVTEEGSAYLKYFKIGNVFSAVDITGIGLREFFIAMQLSIKEYFIFTIRNGIKIKINMRIKYNEELFEVKRIVESDQIVKIVTLKIIGD